jgi:HEAT repeat protein
VIDSAAALEAVVRHATELEDDYDDIAPTLAALAACGDTGLVPRLHEALDRFLDDENFYGRDLIAGILAGIEGPAALPALLRASARNLGDDQDGLGSQIIELLGSDRAAGRRAVLACVTGDSAELRRVGLWALGFVAEPQDVELLLAAATDPDPEVRFEALGALPDPAGDERALRTLVVALRDPVERLRAAAASYLGRTRRAEAVEPLVAIAGDPAPRVRAMVAHALGRLPGDAATPALLRLCHDPDPPVRDHAYEALGSIGSRAAVDALLAFAAGADPQPRARAAQALGRVVDADPRVPQQLSALAQDHDATVRAATVSGLASAATASPRSAPLVAGLADDPDPTVRQCVATVVRRLAPEAAPDILRRYADDPDPTVRRIAGWETAP